MRRSRARLYLRGRVWWTWVYRGGRCFRLSTRCTSLRAAERAAQRFEEEAQESRGGTGAIAREPWTVRQALDNLLDTRAWADRTLRSHESRARAIDSALGSLDLATLSRHDLERFVALREPAVSSHETHKEFGLLRLALVKAREDGHWSGDLAALFPPHSARYRPRDRWLTPAEADLLHRALAPGAHRQAVDHQLWLLVALYTGGRYGEVSALEWTDIDWDLGTVRIRGTKTVGADRTIPLAPELRRRLWPVHQAAGLVVGPWTHVDRDLVAACARAGIPRCSPNDLRRTCASWMAQTGIPELTCARWLGHRDSAMVRRVYAQIGTDAMRAAAEALPAIGGARLAAVERKERI